MTDSDAAVTVVRFDSEDPTVRQWGIVEVAYLEACAVQAGVTDLSVVSMKRPSENLSGLFALIGE